MSPPPTVPAPPTPPTPPAPPTAPTLLPPAAPAEAILLDALGTLVGIEPPWQPLIDLLDQRHGVVVGREEVVGAMRAEMVYYRAHCQGAFDAASLARLRRECAGVMAGELGGRVAALDRAELTQTLLDALRFAAYPEAAGVLRRLRADGARLVVVSNWDISLHEALDQAGILALVDGVVCSAVIGAAKPAVAIFEAALGLAGVAADRALHVGDSYEEDVVGARAAGVAAVLLVRPPAGPRGLLAPSGGAGAADVRTISSLADLIEP